VSGRVALGAIIIAAGVLALLATTGAIDLSYATWIGLVLIGIGLAIAFVPGRHGVLVVLGILVALAGIPALLADEKLFEGGVGEAVERPESANELEAFRQGIGKLTVDLTGAKLDLDGVTVEASIGIGELVVLVPDDTDVSLDIHVAVGNAEALGETQSGFDVDLVGISGTSGSQELTLTLDAGIGNVRVARG
jgi:cell wall-active antibiotic response 4TMS protein YvqF